MNEHRFLDRLARGDLRNVRFTELCRLAKALGFEQRRISGSRLGGTPEAEKIVVQALRWGKPAPVDPPTAADAYQPESFRAIYRNSEGPVTHG